MAKGKFIGFQLAPPSVLWTVQHFSPWAAMLSSSSFADIFILIVAPICLVLSSEFLRA